MLQKVDKTRKQLFHYHFVIFKVGDTHAQFGMETFLHYLALLHLQLIVQEFTKKYWL